MSHFTVLVIGADPEAMLQPFHEFECTGTDDKYVQDIDKTEELRQEFASRTETRLQAADGTLHSFFDERGNWREEFSEPDPGRATWDSDRRRRFVPDGYTVVEVPAAQVETFAEFIEGWSGQKTVPFGEMPDLAGEHKYGHVLLDEAGAVVKVIDRTNPNKKWDWWEVGGRWKNKLLFKDGTSGDEGLAGDLDMDGMLANQATKAGALFDAVTSAIAGREVHSWASVLKRRDAGEFTIEQAREFYNAQPVVKELIQAKVIDDWDGADQLNGILAARDRAHYVACESQVNSSTWALLHEGRWTERGRMGWFGMSDASEGSTLDYAANFWLTLRSLPADAKVTVVDCHI